MISRAVASMGRGACAVPGLTMSAIRSLSSTMSARRAPASPETRTMPPVIMTGSVCTGMLLRQPAAREPYNVQTRQGQSLHQVVGGCGCHEAFGCAGDLSAGGPQGGCENGFDLGIGDRFGGWIEHGGMLYPACGQNKNKAGEGKSFLWKQICQVQGLPQILPASATSCPCFMTV